MDVQRTSGEMMVSRFLYLVCLTAVSAATCFSTPSLAQSKYDPGASDTEIKIGNVVAYSGPASSYGTIGRTEAAYFKKINDEGGINGRKINFISYDDANSPPKAVEQTRKLVEGDEVLLIFNAVGTGIEYRGPEVSEREAGAAALRRNRSNEMGQPQELSLDDRLAAGPTRAKDASSPNMSFEIFPNGKIAVLFQNEDFGKDYLKGTEGRSW